ncbi:MULTISPECIES: outer membrane protein assembly factor BamE [Mameliella]|uniref:Lipoprotein, SmpA/OmlA family n=1 Tax=Mameliella alba TaxID=561184 RepID=A0A0B3STT7_9RHOB|nr:MULTISPECIES: outer membrane protein assembly factor BamE [Mameliella]MCR9274684.1 outer membrane protein assembly factor BamE [Paracoccaceae bacterium]ODM45577.1 cell envelope protein SmpA [Ruegeria sp. PBVC088]KHQ53879.1 Lipoprotein, SmpA/OmlA family [Mameliella alba]PTR42451.1 Beta-barrel assembly machine subunit BamE [Mameliella alba]SDC11296.1 Outer membrane protein assembly factor BamE, lipoprotein component of the BamABCDE complex [Mameliella alba]
MNGFAGKLKAAIAMLMIVGLSACAAQYRTHGYLPSEADLQQIVPGVDTKASVEDLIGVPNAAGVLNGSGYYYIETEVRHFAYQKPKVVERTIVAITFDEADVVSNITTYGLEDGRVVAINRRVTQTTDGDISFIRKLFGNIGGISASNLLGG